jgi:hypothetical protein
VAVAVGVTVGVGVSDGVAVGVAVGVGLGVAVSATVAVGRGLGVALGNGVGSALCPGSARHNTGQQGGRQDRTFHRSDVFPSEVAASRHGVGRKHFVTLSGK